MTKSSKKDINFLFEIGTLRHVDRGWDYLVEVPFQNMAEHTYRVLWASYVIAGYYPKADLEKVIKIAMAYNAYRTRTGDPHYVSLLHSEIQKEEAYVDMFTGTSFENEFTSLLNEYYKKESLESQIVFMANSIENILELKEKQAVGVDIADKWLKLNYSTFYPKKRNDVAAKLVEVIKKVDPSDWHLMSQNFFEFKKKNSFKARKKREIAFLFEVGTVRLLNRSWSQFSSEQFSNVAEHTYRTMWIALLLSISKKADTEKLLLMALVHDLDEVRSLDLNYLQSQYVNTNKVDSVSSTLAQLNQKEFLLEIYKEYKEQKSTEAKLVKDADNLEAIMELKEKTQLGVAVAKKWLKLNEKRLSKKMNYKVSNKLLANILASTSSDWHLSAKNRFLEDW